MIEETIVPGDYISLDNDMWDDCGKRFYVREVSYRPNSSAVDVVLEHNNEVVKRTVSARHIVKVT